MLSILIKWQNTRFNSVRKHSKIKLKKIIKLYFTDSVGNVLAGTQVMIGLIEIVVAITTSTFSCRAVCCRKRHEPGMVFYNANVPNIPNEELFVNSPPDYEEIAGAQALLENDDEMVQKKPI